MPQYLRFILDSDNDDHYTDSLIPLQSEPYLWYRLRRDEYARSIVFLRVREDNQLVLHVYDNDSRQHLMQFAKVRFTLHGMEQSVQPDGQKDYSLQSLQMDEDNVLHKLLDASGKAALVFTYEAFRRVCRNANRRSVQKLTALLEDHNSNDTIFIRLPSQAKNLEKCIHPGDGECQLLLDACKSLIEIPGDKPEPLLPAMTDVLGNRLVRLDDHADEMYWLLLSLDGHSAPDTLDELADQAAYLELCRSLRIRLLAPEQEAERYTPLSVRETAAMLQKPEFRERLRRDVRKLRSNHPYGTIRDALSQEMLLPDALPAPAYSNNLALSLKIPDKCPNRSTLSAKLDTIKRNLITLQTKPRNELVEKIATELCRSCRNAIVSRNWVCLEEIINMLVFFSEQICAGTQRNTEFQTIDEHCTDFINLCVDLKNREKFSLTGLDEISAASIDKADQIMVTRLREGLQRNFRYFERPTLQGNTISVMEEDWKTTVREAEQERMNFRNQETQTQNAAIFDDGDLSDLDSHIPAYADNIVHTPLRQETPAQPDQPADDELPASPWDFSLDQLNSVFEPAPAQEQPEPEPMVDPDQYLAERMRSNSTSYKESPVEFDFG